MCILSNLGILGIESFQTFFKIEISVQNCKKVETNRCLKKS